ncbi:MAG: class I mannose-6-phosphate isomerase [Bacteroidales bacterium]|nr:class I mannose-6-phosphate isomerase [Candidatus Sodaliphilus aphodohippi]
MLILKRIIHSTIWGGPKISKLAGVEGDTIGHLYSLYCREGISNEILNGEWQGRCLNDVFPLFKNEFGLGHFEFFPLTLALTEAHQNLSIQVHPNDKAASELEHKARGKRESWYFIDAPTSGTIINGCTCRDLSQKKMMIEQERFMEMADTLTVEQGDYVFVEPGTLHAITAGSLVFEIEEGSDFTYRFYDYDRTDSQGNKRELHTAKADAALDINLKSVSMKYDGTTEIKEKTYSTKLIKNTNIYTNESLGIECFTLVSGYLTCDGIDVPQGATVMLWPGETLDTGNVDLAFVSKILKDSL